MKSIAQIVEILDRSGQRESSVDPYRPVDETCITARELAKVMKVSRNRAGRWFLDLFVKKVPTRMQPFLTTSQENYVYLCERRRDRKGRADLRLRTEAFNESEGQVLLEAIMAERKGRKREKKVTTVYGRVSESEAAALHEIAIRLDLSINDALRLLLRTISMKLIWFEAKGHDEIGVESANGALGQLQTGRQN